MVASRQVQWREMWMLAVPTSLNLTILNIAGMTMIISAMRQHHRVRVGLPNPRHRIWTDRPDGRHVGSFDGNDETNCPGGRCSRWRATRILVLLSGHAVPRNAAEPDHEPAVARKGRRRSARRPFLAGRLRNWRYIGFRTYAETLRREVGQSLGILRNQSVLC